MLKKIITICFTICFITLNVQAGSDGELTLKNDPKKIKDCFEKLNRATFALNQSLDKLRGSVDRLYDLMSEKDVTMKELTLKVDYLERAVHRYNRNNRKKPHQ